MNFINHFVRKFALLIFVKNILLLLNWHNVRYNEIQCGKLFLAITPAFFPSIVLAPSEAVPVILLRSTLCFSDPSTISFEIDWVNLLILVIPLARNFVLNFCSNSTECSLKFFCRYCRLIHQNWCLNTCVYFFEFLNIYNCCDWSNLIQTFVVLIFTLYFYISNWVCTLLMFKSSCLKGC